MVSFTQLLTAGLLATSTVAIPHGHVHEQTIHLKRTSPKSLLPRENTSKRGAAYNDAATVGSLSSSGTVGWAYDWNMYSNGDLPEGVEFVPMLWGSKMFGEWFVAIETLLASASSASYIMGFNEPDMPEQANMGAGEAAGYYRDYITKFSGQAKLVTPAVTNGVGEGLGLTWMRDFLNQCQDCGISVLAVHWYGESSEDFLKYVDDAVDLANEFNLESTWVTEFALNQDMNAGGASDVSVQFLKDVIPKLDENESVGRYAYFMCKDGFLLSDSGLSISGQAYIE
ncbi:hypothetical protein P170DRAFT_470807 [Aspergillus steynii IBT 23096]|uniref:Asl1-like glycosyl hydrolase catalytic domain-containing protein n=1 Tax=Aspergillus steynii IBT 23096 TaxID=1392250 RepID=A0A2I2GR84_9EURO|nr:uncharacterized protein P170DRAFT_470807 [Aspergillus steynii IBT 23096]PLB55389.1 hypothetical protein P170DRAFT_470807 [Aspergillus steynii IBT 23096]